MTSLSSTPNEPTMTGSSDRMRVVSNGTGIVVARSTFTVLIGDADSQRAHDVWRAIGAENSVHAIIDVLARDGVRSMPDVVIASSEGGQLRVIVRGAVVADVMTANSHAPSGDHYRIDGATIRSLTETTFEGWRSCLMYLSSVATDEVAPALNGEPTGGVVFLSSGVAPASAVRWECDVDAEAGAAPTDDKNSQARSTSAQRVSAAAESSDDTDDTDDTGDADGDVTSPDTSAVNTETVDADAVLTDPVEIDDDAGADDPYADMFGRTVHRDVQAAAVVVVGETAHETASETAHDGEPAGSTDESFLDLAPSNDTRPLADFKDVTPREPDADGAASNETSLTNSTSETTSTPFAAPISLTTSPAPGLTEDHDGHTISLTQLRRQRGDTSLTDSSTSAATESTPTQPATEALTALAAPDQPVPGPTVQAVLCAAGHPNPAYSSHCRICDQPVSGATVVVARPSLGRLISSTGETVELDRPVLVGRNPSVTGRRVSEIPHEWRIANGDGLSRNHAMFHIDGWQVRVEDLGSVNATTVILPGREPEMLRTGEPVLITDGTLIDLGGEVTCRYDASS